MVSVRLLLLSGFACLATAFTAADGHVSHLVVTPQSPVLEIGTNFTATCTIVNTDEITVDDLYWRLSNTSIPEEHYKKINRTLSVTFPVRSEKAEWLMCQLKRPHQVILHEGKFIQGIWLRTGYRPGKPENLSCKAFQEKSSISPIITCEWEVTGRQTKDVPTTYMLIATYGNDKKSTSTPNTKAQLSLSTFPDFMLLDIWVEARNDLGTVSSEHLNTESNCIVKPNPPSEVKVISEKEFPSSLLINWTHSLNVHSITFQIRYCTSGSHMWTYVPLADIVSPIKSFRLQDLHPYTDYVIQLRGKMNGNDCGYWSNWSTNMTKRTPEDIPSSKPDLWSTIVESGPNRRQVKLIAKDPQRANGNIRGFDISILYHKHGNPELESIPVNRSEEDSRSSHRRVNELKEISLADNESVLVAVTANNSVGTSPKAYLGIPAKSNRPTPVKDLKVWSHEGQLYLEWKLANNTTVSEYVIEWIKDDGTMWPNWQREAGSVRQTTIKGELERFVCYNVSVYPIRSRWVRKPARLQAFLEEGVPLKGPSLELMDNPGHDKAKLVWKEIPREMRQGFITNYTIFFRSGDRVSAVTVPGNTTSYTLTQLLHNTRYDVWMQASTVRGPSRNGTVHSFTTTRYESMAAIVVGVSCSFLVLVLVLAALCFCKRDAIKKNLWPQIPDPGESTIGTWSPDYPLKAETPKENCLSGISVLDVGVCDAKRGFEEDKASLSLKKDKYLSEEHSSGIGGSSCMSSPRQSVSDSDEGADMADTTASTVQYSSVVASSGYKGQTPAFQPQHSIFSRSESTQPLLDSEENTDLVLQDGSQHFQRFPRQSCFTQPENPDSEDCGDFQQLDEDQMDFCPFEEDTELTAAPDGLSADAPSASSSSYMPQLGGYRPQ
ncbi:interleukin-6 receptor subunit beta isoform X2 [Melanotaenia boesemani]|uniref:interleukin-6 receptor subunit beta isoform X2 n=1 Tax=Melanotaenia boesemani TaxID=1250792 RepID=UPI001C046E3D|nr:interleukin-6 receptor subunit beta isoform X2 [Melanotaenia boesemani]